ALVLPLDLVLPSQPLLHFFFLFLLSLPIFSLSLHDALPISLDLAVALRAIGGKPVHHLDDPVGDLAELCLAKAAGGARRAAETEDRKSTRLNSSHVSISYAVFCLIKKT